MTWTRDRIRTLIWLAIATLLAIAAYAEHAKPGKRVFFDSELPKSALFEAIALGVPALLLAMGDWELLGFRRPHHLRRALGVAVLAIAGTSLIEWVISQFANLDKEQGIAPTHWIHGHTPAFVLSFIAVCVVVPIVEETFFRGAGLGLFMRQYPPIEAIVLCGCMFGLAHGLVLGFLPLAFLGSMLALMRYTTGSVIPGIVLHAAYNTLAVVATLTL